MIYDWEPFENTSLNYPVGSHFLIAVLATLTQLPLHTVFKLLIPLLGILTTAQIYLFSLQVAKNKEVAIYSALAYGCCTPKPGNIDLASKWQNTV